MMNFKKSLLSVAAATAIAATSLAANYVPLTTTTTDNTWVLFGVSGLKSASGALVAGEDGVFSIADSADYALTDTSDETAGGLSVYGVTSSDGKNLVELYNINQAKVEIRINPVIVNSTEKIAYDETDPVKTIYVKLTEAGSPAFSVSYKSSLEGYTMEYSIDDGDVYEIKLDSDYVYSNAGMGTMTTADDNGDSDSNYISSLISDATTNSAVDYNLSNNPVYFQSWDADLHADAIDEVGATANIRFYTYDAANQDWLIYDSENTLSNTFSTLKQGKAYWARLDTNASENTTSNDEGELAGVVLGQPSESSTFYDDAGLADGWNFISFSKQSTIKDVSTGMILDINSSNAAATMTIVDSSGLNSLTITGIDGNSTAGDTSDAAKKINAEVALAKAKGLMPITFDLKAFPATPTADKLVLISSRRFTIKDDNDNFINTATTLSGAGSLLYPNDGTDDTLWFTDLGTSVDVNATGAMGIYGEYAMVIETPYGSDSSIAAGAAKYQVKSAAGVNESFEDISSATNISLIATNISGNSTAIDNAVPINLSMDGNASHVLVAADTEFSIRDHTFVRVFDFVAGDANTTVTYDGNSNGTEISSDGNDTDAATQINTIANLSASPSSDNKVIVLNTETDNSKYQITESGDLLKPAKSTSNMARGAIADAFSLSNLAKKDIYAVLDLNITTDSVLDGVDDNLTITYTTIYAGGIFESKIVSDANYTNNDSGYLSFLTTQIKSTLAEHKVNVDVKVNTDNGSDLNSSIIQISGPDLVGADFNFTTGAAIGDGEANLTATASEGYLFDGSINTLGTYAGDLTADVKYNFIKTPNYPMDGPLYDMKENGFTLQALVSGYSNIDDGTVAWESIDLTGDPDTWFTSQNYDLFDTYTHGGYWAKLSSMEAGNTITVDAANVTFTPEYTYYFHKDPDDVETTYNFITGTLSVTVNGMMNYGTNTDYETARVVAEIGGHEFELTKSDTEGSTTYSAEFSTYDLPSYDGTGKALSVKVKVADGLGNRFEGDFADIIDNTKPLKPVVTTVNGEKVVAFGDGDTDGAAFYVYASSVPSEGTWDDLVTAGTEPDLLSAPGAITVACEGSKANYDDTADGLSVVVVDGDGTYGNSNMSDFTSIGFMPILVDRVLLIAPSDGSLGTDSTATIYSSTCESTGTVGDAGTTTGVTLKIVTGGALGDAKVAYDYIGSIDTNGVPIVAYVEVDNYVLELKYYPEYVADLNDRTVFISSPTGKVYGFQLQTETELNDLSNSDSNAINVDDNPTLIQEKAGISL